MDYFLIKKAIELFKNKNYYDALNLFLDAEEVYGYGLFYANIIFCTKKIGIKKNKNLKKIGIKKNEEKDIELIKKSPFFDSNWYVAKNQDVITLGMEPAIHYYRYGLFLRNNPGPDFCGSFYIDTNPICIRNKINPLIHLIKDKDINTKDSQYINNVMWAANRSIASVGFEYSVNLARKNLPPELQYTISILEANYQLELKKNSNWLYYINKYLTNFGLSPLVLKDGLTLLDQLSTDNLESINSGPLVSIIMPAWNAEKTIKASVRSIISQTWKNLELIVVDDASNDGTWKALQEMVATDKRIKIFRNKVNVGPYVSKNIALKYSIGDWVTGHDADDWAHPQRLEKHLSVALSENLVASLTYMIRMRSNGKFEQIGKITEFSLDGVARKALISCLFKRKFIIEKLGHWDSVRFGADSEMVERANSILGGKLKNIPQIGMICLDLESSLTNHPEYGLKNKNGISPIRAKYKESWSDWHKSITNENNAYLDLMQSTRRFLTATEMVVNLDDIKKNI